MIQIYICTHIQVYILMGDSLYIYIQTYIHIYIYGNIHLNIYTYIITIVNIYIHTHIYIYIYKYINLYTYIYYCRGKTKIYPKENNKLLFVSIIYKFNLAPTEEDKQIGFKQGYKAVVPATAQIPVAKEMQKILVHRSHIGKQA